MDAALSHRPASPIRLAVVAVLAGVGSGLAGALISVVLHGLEQVAFGYSEGSFLDGVTTSPPERRIIALAIAGVIGGVGWYALRRWARPVVSVEASVAGERMPTSSTAANVGLQVAIVGLGASIGREVAPRELGALTAAWLSDKARLSSRQRRIFVACGAGAGLAAVYNVPLGGALFTVEVLLSELSFATVIPALAISAIATIVGWIAVPTTALYVLPRVFVTPSLVIWAVIVGPVLGVAASGFVRLIGLAGEHRRRGWLILLVMPAVFLGVGLLSIPFPVILGNGRALGQTAFDGGSGLAAVAMIATLALVKVVATAGTIGSGAAGGTLTPSVAVGACLGAAAGGIWSMFWPGTPIAAFALVGAAAFLSSTLAAPFTAVILMIEFTHEGPQLIVPIALAVVGALLVSRFLSRGHLVGSP